MKQKQKKIYSLIAICMIFAFSSCQDDFNENGLSKKDGIIMKKFSLTNSKKEKPNFKLLKAIDNLKNEIQNKKSNNKIVYDSIYDFYYDDENGIYIENNGKNSYTFPITRTNGDDKVEDIVFNLNQDNEYDIVLVKYDVTNQEALSLTEAEILDTDIVITDIQTKFAISCGMYIVMCDNNGSGGTGPLHVAGSGCHSSSHLSVEWVSSDCIGGGGGSSGLGGGEILTTPHGGYGSGSDIEMQAYAVIHSLFLNKSQLSWINDIDNNDTKIEIVKYVLSNGSSANSKSFAIWSINYLISNPNVTLAQFKNWFMGSSEGRDGDYDAVFWENPNLTFPQQALPTLVNFMNAYPKRADGVTFMTGAELFPLVGGQVYSEYLAHPTVVRGACALKVSRALNYSGINIPNITTTNNNPGTIQGSDGKYYFVNAKALNKWMRLTFGTNPATSTTPYNVNHHHFTANQGGVHGENFPTLLAGIKGIYSMVSPTAIEHSWASGHADLIYNSTCAAATNCHFYDPINHFVPVDYIDVWELP